MVYTHVPKLYLVHPHLVWWLGCHYWARVSIKNIKIKSPIKDVNKMGSLTLQYTHTQRFKLQRHRRKRPIEN